MITIMDSGGKVHVTSTSIINYNTRDRQTGNRCFIASGLHGIIKFSMTPMNGRYYSFYPNTSYFVTEEDLRRDRGLDNEPTNHDGGLDLDA